MCWGRRCWGREPSGSIRTEAGRKRGCKSVTGQAQVSRLHFSYDRWDICCPTSDAPLPHPPDHRDTRPGLSTHFTEGPQGTSALGEEPTAAPDLPHPRRPQRPLSPGPYPPGRRELPPQPQPQAPPGLLLGDLRNCPREVPVLLREELLERLKPFLSLLLHLGVPRWGSHSPLGRQGHPQAPGPSWRHRGRALLARGACHLLGTWGL